MTNVEKLMWNMLRISDEYEEEYCFKSKEKDPVLLATSDMIFKFAELLEKAISLDKKNHYYN